MAEMFQVVSLMAGVAVVFVAMGYVNRRGDRASAQVLGSETRLRARAATARMTPR
ncbi:hypothetical protein [Mycobacterium sp. AZCC_0083]|uniref:hypothetical protein n=1 Tax=Mycobacterium sp. AZCC_0083 TaxID=2735882 RepID=UPI0016123C54|nr:hypothetical protein [Mycobacterium sp. AZCC_0083]MBB5162837.1 hypothetical protein [Mycobacterium sp. AZCC_0083]